MGEMYNRIVALCKERGIKPGRVCSDTGLSRGMMSDLKMGRTKELSVKNTKIIADYFGVTTDYLLTGEETKKAPTQEDEREIDDRKMKVAFLGGMADGLSDEAIDRYWNDARGYIGYKIQQDKNKTD